MRHQYFWSAPGIAKFFADLALAIPPMLLAVAGLVVIEVVVLQQAGFRYVPRSTIKKIRTTNFFLVGNGEWGVSRISLQRAGGRYPLCWDILVQNLRDRQPPVQLKMSHLEPRELAVSPAGDSFAISTQDGTICVWDGLTIRGARRTMSATETTQLAQLCYSPDGKFLVAAGLRSVSVWQAASGELLHQLNHPDGSKGVLSFSSDSRKLLSCGYDNQLRLWDTQTGKLLKSVNVGTATLDSATISPNGRFAGCTSRQGPVFLIDLELEKVLWQQPSEKYLTSSQVAFSPDGALLATQYRKSTVGHGIDVWDTASGKLVQHLNGHESDVAGVAFGPDDSLYSWDLVGITKRWDIKTGLQTWQFSAFQWASRSTTFL